MRILSFEYEDRSSNWFLQNFEFNKVNLLVGLSGVGKTKILSSLLNIKKIAFGIMENVERNGVKWGLMFEHKGFVYQWSGEYEQLKHTIHKNLKSKSISAEYNSLPIEKIFPRLISEKLTKKGEKGEEVILFNRTLNTLQLFEYKVPKITPHESVLSVFNEEEEIRVVNDAFRRMLFINYDLEMSISILNKEKNLDKPASFSKLRNSNLPILAKLLLTNKYYVVEFNNILLSFKDVFPQIVNIRFEKVVDEDSDEVWELQVKEEHTGWLLKESLSSGMIKTFLHISLMHLLPDESVILIDEVENGLGVNCLHVITEDIQVDRRNIQFILTSHHPYIINNIDVDKWKIVTRRGSKVTLKDPKEFHLGKSKHELFKQLINLEVYSEGVQ